MTKRNFDKLMRDYIDAKKAADDAKKAADNLKNAIIRELDRRGIDEYNTGDHVAKRTESSQIRLDSKAIRDEFPEIYVEYGKNVISVRLTVK